MAGNLFHRKGQDKVQLEICLIEKVQARSGFRFNSLKRPKQGKSEWRFILLNMKKQGTAVDLFHSKC